jgi:hypothetical protein
LDGFTAVGDGGSEAVAEKGFVEGFDEAGEEAERNLRGGTEVGGADRQASRIENGNGVAGLGVFGTVNVGGINPDMTGGETIRSPALNPEGRTLHVLPF